MDKNRRKELREAYKRVKTYMGVFQVRNNVNGKSFIGVSPNLKNRWLTLKGQLEMGRHANAGWQQDWNEFGPDAFTYQVIEQQEADDIADMKWELKKLQKAWLEKLQPYGANGYNQLPKE